MPVIDNSKSTNLKIDHKKWSKWSINLLCCPFGSGQTLVLANATMNYKKREISIYFRVRLGLDTFRAEHCR